MRLFISLLVVSAMSASSAGVARADVCAASSVDCQAHPILFADESGLFDSIQYDTGFVPGGSPFQLRAALFLGAGTHVGMAGQLVASHPPSVTLTAVGDLQAGMLQIDFGFEAAVQARLVIDDLGIDETFDVPIPGVPSDLRFFALEYFDPFLLGPLAVPVEVEDDIQRFTLVTIDLLDLIAPIPGFDGGLRLEVGGKLAASYVGTSLEVQGVAEIVEEGGAVNLPPHLPEGYGARRSLSVIKHGVVEHRGDLSLHPTLFVTVFGAKVFQTDIASIPVPIVDSSSDVTFPPADVTLLFADVEVDPLKLEFGSVLVGQTSEKLFRVYNHGDAPLRWTLPSAAGAFVSPRESGEIPPGSSSYVRLVFSPSEAGAIEERIVIGTNDPDRPEVEITLVGEAQSLPEIGPIDAGIVEDAGDLSDPDGGELDGSVNPSERALAGCGCDAAGRSSVPLAELALVVLALGIGRMRRRAVSRTR